MGAKSSPSKVYSKICIVCGTGFSSLKPYGIYCSKKCKSKNQKSRKEKSADPLRFFSNYSSLPAEVSFKIKEWRKIAQNKKITVLQNGSKKNAVEKLKELGYPEYLSVKPVAFSEDNKLMITVNILQQYTIEILKF